MYNHRDPATGDAAREFYDGLRSFMYQVTNEPFARENGTMFYPCQRTAAKMRWHAQHTTRDGEIMHPSDAKAWKHFQTMSFSWNDYNRFLSTQGVNRPHVRHGSSAQGTSPVVHRSRTAASPQTPNSQNDRAGGSTPPPTNPNSPLRPSHSATQPPTGRLNNLTLEELLENPGLVATVRSIFERDFKELHVNWTQTPEPVITHWFGIFAQIYNCDQSINDRVKDEFETKLKDRMCDQISRLKAKWKNKELFKEGSRIDEQVSQLCSGDNIESIASGGLYVHAKNKINVEVAPKKKSSLYGVGSLHHEASSAHTGPLPPRDDSVDMSQKLALAEACIATQA
ncbi:unnamed protein product [Arabidopsis arenosa]|uniref:Uncharacterized protein n=1 Tax=Arabidopsis arenosa TaxID=38785 RepID=A0A8S2A9J3_ARAAE|nr:unnamed protein product [Arabidopsis arenosa]